MTRLLREISVFIVVCQDARRLGFKEWVFFNVLVT